MITDQKRIVSFTDDLAEHASHLHSLEFWGWNVEGFVYLLVSFHEYICFM